MQQIHADDDDDVVDKNPIYYALQKIDDEKLNYLAYKFNQDKKYMQEHGRLHREISRPDFKEKVYRKIFELVTLHTDKLDGIDGIDTKSKITVENI
jgi:ABC-type microcin C transport system permease subunit YejB